VENKRRSLRPKRFSETFSDRCPPIYQIKTSPNFKVENFKKKPHPPCPPCGESGRPKRFLETFSDRCWFYETVFSFCFSKRIFSNFVFHAVCYFSRGLLDEIKTNRVENKWRSLRPKRFPETFSDRCPPIYQIKTNPNFEVENFKKKPHPSCPPCGESGRPKIFPETFSDRCWFYETVFSFCFSKRIFSNFVFHAVCYFSRGLLDEIKTHRVENKWRSLRPKRFSETFSDRCPPIYQIKTSPNFKVENLKKKPHPPCPPCGESGRPKRFPEAFPDRCWLSETVFSFCFSKKIFSNFVFHAVCYFSRGLLDEIKPNRVENKRRSLRPKRFSETFSDRCPPIYQIKTSPNFKVENFKKKPHPPCPPCGESGRPKRFLETFSDRCWFSETVFSFCFPKRIFSNFVFHAVCYFSRGLLDEIKTNRVENKWRSLRPKRFPGTFSDRCPPIYQIKTNPNFKVENFKKKPHPSCGPLPPLRRIGATKKISRNFFRSLLVF
jgi:uncharacterized protein YbdZ (MbtH family)